MMAHGSNTALFDSFSQTAGLAHGRVVNLAGPGCICYALRMTWVQHGRLGILVSLGCPNKMPQTGWPTSQTLTFPLFWRLESPRSSCWQIWLLGRALSLAHRQPLSVSSHGLSPCIWREVLGVSSASYKDTNPVGPGPHPMILFNLNYSPKGPVSKCSHIGG